MWRPKTLFARLAIAQAVTAVALVTLMGVVFYMDRNLALARLVGERWAPALGAALGGMAGADPAKRDVLFVEQRHELPPLSVKATEHLPRLEVLTETLRKRGIPVEEIAFSRAETRPLMWLGIRDTGGQRLWLGIEDDLIEPLLPLRGLFVLVAGLLMLALASWWIAHWIASPLARLRDRIADHDPARARSAQASAPDAGATVEVAEIEAAWQHLHEKLDRHQAERQLLLAGVSHDLRSPLARIRLSAELLPELPELAARRESIVRNVDVADRLLGSFLDLVRADTLPLNETVDLAELARDIGAHWGHPEQRVDVEAPGSLMVGGANAVLLERAMRNLLDNAFAHGRPPVLLRVHGPASEPCVEVCDRGSGIPVDQQAQLVQAFARGDASRGTPGTGLGLAVVAHVAARLDASLVFETRDAMNVVQLRIHR